MKVGKDVMSLNGSDYVVVVDYYSKWPEVSKQERKNALCIITHLNSIFS